MYCDILFLRIIAENFDTIKLHHGKTEYRKEAYRNELPQPYS